MSTRTKILRKHGTQDRTAPVSIDLEAIRARLETAMDASNPFGIDEFELAQVLLIAEDVPALLAELTRTQRAAETLGTIITQQNAAILAAAGMEMPEGGDADYEAAWAIVAGLRPAVRRIQALHSSVGGVWCDECTDRHWPCRTRRALGGDDA